MFNFGITEIMLIAVIGLVVIGPERLPKVARTLGHMFGRMQRYVSDVKSDISKEMQLEELKSLQKTMQETAEEVQESVSQQVNFIETEIKDADKGLQQTVKDGLKGSGDVVHKNGVNQIQVKPTVEPHSTGGASEDESRLEVEVEDKAKHEGDEIIAADEDKQETQGINLAEGLGFGSVSGDKDKVDDGTDKVDTSPSEGDQSTKTKNNSEVT